MRRTWSAAAGWVGCALLLHGCSGSSGPAADAGHGPRAVEPRDGGKPSADATDAAPSTPVGTSDASATASDASAGASAGTDDPCSIAALREPAAEVTYYVAIDEPGSDNAACDGLSPTDQGGGRCPFKDFSSDATLHLLDGRKSTRVEVRSGTYVIRGWDGLRVHGTGATEAERVVLSAHAGEQPVLDVAAPDGAGCTADTAPMQPACVREVVRISGQYTVVQGLRIQNGLGYHVEITGGAHHLLRCNTLGETVAFGMRSDLLKLDGGATDVRVLHNELTRFRSQAIDMTQVSDVLIEGNDFHDPVDADAGATGAKFGVRNITIRNNRIHDMGADTAMHAFALGGTGTAHADDHTAYGVHVVANQVWNIAGLVAQVASCQGCSVRDNTVWNAGAGVQLSASATGLPECTAAPSGCGASTGTRISGNRLRGLDGGGDPAQANVFIAVDPGEGDDLQADDNLYCAPTAADARFGLDGMFVGFDAWRVESGTDSTSTAAAASDPRCQAF